ncbi:hypothetical protein KAT92_03330 [Candidatus Babeliales bacterium]|nr:hypothetical protein [Candidatus Babeliales bacterium]
MRKKDCFACVCLFVGLLILPVGLLAQETDELVGASDSALLVVKQNLITFLKANAPAARKSEFDFPIEKARKKITFPDYLEMKIWQFRSILGKKFEPHDDFFAFYDDSGIKLKRAIIEGLSITIEGLKRLEKAVVQGALAGPIKALTGKIKGKRRAVDKAYEAYKSDPDEGKEAVDTAKESLDEALKELYEKKNELYKQALNIEVAYKKGAKKETVISFFRREFMRLAARTKYWKLVADHIKPFIAATGLDPEEFIREVREKGVGVAFVEVAKIPGKLQSVISSETKRYKKEVSAEVAKYDKAAREGIAKGIETADQVKEVARKEIAAGVEKTKEKIEEEKERAAQALEEAKAEAESELGDETEDETEEEE